MQKVIVGTLLAVVVIAAFVGLSMNESAAMADCQQRHTYETCFRMLNR